MLRIEHLTKTYGGKRAVDDLSLHIEPGQIYGFIGHNGAGKTTTIKACCGILKTATGEIYIDGRSVKAEPLECKRVLAYIPDNPDMYDFMTGAAYLNFICDVFDVPSALREERLNKYLDLFSLRDAIGKQIKSYSHGMKQKLNIIGALIHEPKVWILDEPMTGLDPKSSYNLKRLMREHADKGNCVFFSSHVLDVVEKVCDKVGIIDAGKLVADCTLAELKAQGLDSSLEELFLKITDSPRGGGSADAEEAPATEDKDGGAE